MTTVDEIVAISINETQGATGLANFETPSVIADDTPNSSFGASNRAKRYNLTAAGLAEVGTDFGTSSATYLAVSAMTSQSPRPTYVYVIKRDTAVAKVMTLTFSATLASGDTVAGSVNGESVSVAWNTDMDTTLGDICTAIAAIEGVASATDNDTDTITITATAEWEMTVGDFTATGGDEPTITTATSNAGRQIGDDIADAIAETSTNLWYGIAPTTTNKGALLSAAAYIENTKKFLFVQSSESGIKTTGSTTDLAYRMYALNYRRTVGFYRAATTDYINAAALSKFLGYDPGSVQLHMMELTAVTADVLTSTEVSEIQGRGFNTFESIGGSSVIVKGWRVKGQKPASTTRDIDYWHNELQSEIFGWIKNQPKAPYSSAGFASLKSIGQNVNDRMVAEGVLSADYGRDFYVPSISSLSASDISNQAITGVIAYGTLQRGIVSVSITIEASI